MAQQAASPAAPAAQTVQVTKAEAVLLQKMESIVKAAKKAGSLDVKAVSAVLDKAAKTPVSDAVMSKLVALACSAAPEEAPKVAAAAAKAYGPAVTKAQVQNVVAAAVSTQPNHFASVQPICNAVKAALGNSPVADSMGDIAILVAEDTPDNPLPDVTDSKNAAGALVDPVGGDTVGTIPSEPVSDGAGKY